MLPSGTYDVVLADPPWAYSGSQTKWGAAAKFYDTMTDDEILALDVKSLLKKTSVVFLWATGPRLDFAIRTLAAWGLHYRGAPFVWVKTSKAGIPFGARGVRPSIVKPTTEFVLAGSLTKSGRPMKLFDESVPQVVMAPLGRHSEKPDEVQARIERLYPEASRIELFARRERPGWVSWGLEVNHA